MSIFITYQSLASPSAHNPLFQTHTQTHTLHDMTYGYPTWDAYNRRVQVLKSAREMAANEWARFRNEVDSEVKLEVLRAYINAVLAYVSELLRLFSIAS